MILARPDVWEENLLAYRGWWDLTPERYAGLGEGVIPFKVIRAYAQEINTPALELLRKLRPMDKAYLAFRKKQEEEREKNDERRQRTPNRKAIHRKR